MQKPERVKLTIELVVKLLNEGRSVGDIALMTGNHDYAVRYLLRKHGCHRVVRWECTNVTGVESAAVESGA